MTAGEEHCNPDNAHCRCSATTTLLHQTCTITIVPTEKLFPYRTNRASAIRKAPHTCVIYSCRGPCSPSEPQQHSAEHSKHHRVTGHVHRVAHGVKAAQAGAHKPGAHHASEAASHVDDSWMYVVRARGSGIVLCVL
eukprot:scaffold45372_cov22-Tisochrysis_lutea.AAC.1